MVKRKYVYKIRRTSDGLYSNGGVTPKFSEEGKRWDRNGLKRHFAVIDSYRKWGIGKIYGYDSYPSIEIVQFEETLSEVGVVSFTNLE